MRYWIAVLALLLGACSSGQGGGSGKDGVTGIEGVWVGSRTTTVYVCILGICAPDGTRTHQAMALAAADGTIHLQSDRAISGFAGSARASKGKVKGRLNHICDPLDGPPIFGHVNIRGSYKARQTMDLTYDFDECLGRGEFNLTFHTSSLGTPSPAAIAGTWSAQEATITIDSAGDFLGADHTGCILSGNILPGSDAVHIYRVSLRVENCGATDGQYTGLAGMTVSTSGPDSLMVGAVQDGAIAWLGLQR